MDEKLAGKITAFEKAINNWRESLNLDIADSEPILQDTVRSGQIQKFEFCAELLWKTLKEWLFQVEGLNLASPKSVLKAWLETNYCTYEEYEMLTSIIDYRNRLSHVYNEEQFVEIWKRQKSLTEPFLKVLRKLKP